MLAWLAIRVSYGGIYVRMRASQRSKCVSQMFVPTSTTQSRLRRFMCVARRLIRLRTENQRWRAYALSLIKENRWRAQRYGLDDGLVDFGKGKVIPWSELLNEMLDLIYEDAVALECEDEVNHLRLILERGTSAHWQLRAFETAIANGASQEEALKEVVSMLVRETEVGLPQAIG